MSEIKMLVLSNGEKLAGIFEQSSTNPAQLIKCINPVIFKDIMSPQGPGVAPVPVPTSDNSIEINIDQITIMPFKPKDEFLNIYFKLTSNLTIPQFKTTDKNLKTGIIL